MKKTRVVTGCNDIATTHPEYVKYFLNKDDAYHVARWSEKQISVVCPDCGNITLKRACDLISYPFNCKKCGDKSSYPNKYVYGFLLQLSNMYKFNIAPEYVFEWAKHLTSHKGSRRIYDFYIYDNDRHIIIEVHGGQHYDGSFYQYPGARNLDDERRNDEYKKELALSNGILDNQYIVIDARKSESDWIKNSIMTSGIKAIYPFVDEDIDWNKCASCACKSLVKTSSELWNSGIKNTIEISRQIGRSVNMVISYLKKAHELGWCDYTTQYLKRRSRKAILCLDNNVAFESAHICSLLSSEIFGIHLRTNTLQTSTSVHRRYRGYLFEYLTAEEFGEHYKQYPNLTFMDEYFINNNIIN